jgi:hypothetical protein
VTGTIHVQEGGQKFGFGTCRLRALGEDPCSNLQPCRPTSGQLRNQKLYSEANVKGLKIAPVCPPDTVTRAESRCRFTDDVSLDDKAELR